MRSFFVQIFLSFWVSTIAIFVAANLAFPRGDFFRPDNLLSALESFMRQVTQLQIERSPAQNCEDLRPVSLFVFDHQGEEICGKSALPEVKQLAARARSAGTRQITIVGSFWALGERITGQDGHGFVAVLLTPLKRGQWFPHLPPYAIPVSALVTFVFAYLLTKPVRALRSAFRRFSAGDMSVRLPVARNALRDWGGADVRTLMIDFNEMADRIQALLEAHKTLLRDVSHELRSPLARLNVALELAREEAGDVAHALDRAELESSRLNALIGELLSLSLMETIHDVPNSKLVQLGEVVEKLMPDLKFEADARGGRVIHNRKNACPVLGSEDLLRRALENVIRNAIRYSPSGAEVTVETSTEPAEAGTTAIVRVCDSGPGVPQESLQAIFRPFYRVDSARQTTTGGVGVGLAIAQRAVQLHGGTIRAFNRKSGGLCVELCLPSARSTAVHGVNSASV